MDEQIRLNSYIQKCLDEIREGKRIQPPLRCDADAVNWEHDLMHEYVLYQFKLKDSLDLAKDCLDLKSILIKMNEVFLDEEKFPIFKQFVDRIEWHASSMQGWALRPLENNPFDEPNWRIEKSIDDEKYTIIHITDLSDDEPTSKEKKKELRKERRERKKAGELTKPTKTILIYECNHLAYIAYPDKAGYFEKLLILLEIYTGIFADGLYKPKSMRLENQDN